MKDKESNSDVREILMAMTFELFGEDAIKGFNHPDDAVKHPKNPSSKRFGKDIITQICDVFGTHSMRKAGYSESETQEFRKEILAIFEKGDKL